MVILVPRLVVLKSRAITVTYRCPPFSRVWLGETLARLFLRVRLHGQSFRNNQSVQIPSPTSHPGPPIILQAVDVSCAARNAIPWP